MRVFTNGKTHVACTESALYAFRNDALLCHTSLAAGDKQRPFSVAPSGAFAWVGPKLARVELREGAAPVALDLEVLDVVALDDRRVAAILVRGRGRAAAPTLCIGEPPTRPGGKWEREIPLTADAAPRAAWPAGLVWTADATPWSRAASFAPATYRSAVRPVRLCTGPHGIAVVGVYTGLVAVLREGAAALDTVVRLPTQDEASLDAVASADGVFVTLVVEGRHAALLHVDGAGAVRGHVAGFGFSPAALLRSDRLVTFDDHSEPGGLVVDAATLAVRARLDLGVSPDDACASPAGDAVALGGESRLVVLRADDGGLEPLATHDLTELERDQKARGAERGRARYEPRRLEGPPALGFPALKRGASPWEAPAGAPFAIPLLLRSMGGRGRGVRLELGGPAVAEGLIRPEHASIGGVKAQFQRSAGGAHVATLEGVPIPEGVAHPFDPKPRSPEDDAAARVLLEATHIEASVHVVPERAGSAMLAITASPLQGKSAPMKWTRPFSVT